MAQPRTREQALLVASGDTRESANRGSWSVQAAFERDLARAMSAIGCRLRRAHPYRAAHGHGFIASQREGIDVFSRIDPGARLVVAVGVWQYTQHVLPGLWTHKGPILTVAPWRGEWPGLVGMLNLNGSLTKAGIRHSTLWADDLGDARFRSRLAAWVRDGVVRHPLRHVMPATRLAIPQRARRLGERLAREFLARKSIMGVFDEGCMGMFNAIIPDELLARVGVFKERLSQSALYAAAMAVPEREAEAAFRWIERAGMRFDFGRTESRHLTKAQVLLQCRMYIAALRIADELGCDAIGIQYQQGLKDCLPASDLAEGMLNDSVRPPVRNARGTVIARGRPMPHFNEVDECAGLDALLTARVHAALRQPLETTLHDIRWGDWDRSGSTDEFVWVFEISGAAPPSHFVGGWKGARGERQPPVYFRLGGSTLKGVSKPGEIVWSRIFVRSAALHMDVGRAGVVALPERETERRWRCTTPQWPIMHAVTYGVTRDQMMAAHQANHVQVAYARGASAADEVLHTKVAMAQALGMTVRVCGTRKGGEPWPS